MTKEQVLQDCQVEGMIVKLPSTQLDRNLYMDVAKSLQLIGGKWKGGKTQGFVFNEDPTELLEQIATGEKRNLKKEFQFFGTPDSLADRLVELAEININDRVLEPSAGQGEIIKAINRQYPKMDVECFELMPVNKIFLNKISTAILIGDDFLTVDEPLGFDKIVANPPFNKNQDIDHIRMMYSLLKQKGRLVSISSKHWQQSSNKKEVAFKNWLKEIKADIIEVDGGEFKESGTIIATVIIVINK